VVDHVRDKGTCLADSIYLLLPSSEQQRYSCCGHESEGGVCCRAPSITLLVLQL
jgi:hypothetical protein